MIVGDSPQSLAVNLTEAQADRYFADRQAYGINSAWIQVLCNSYTGGRSDGTTYDGLAPFTTADDFSTPNPAYFKRLADMVNLAAKHGITVFLGTADTGGWLDAIKNNGTDKDFKFGEYLGNLFKDSENIIYFNGNDYNSQDWQSADPYVTAIAKGIKSVDSRHMQTVEFGGGSTSRDDSSWTDISGLNGIYSYNPSYALALKGYNQTPIEPTYGQEYNYEFENNTGGRPADALILRMQEYWTMLSGADGQLSGSHYTWNTQSWADEQAHLGTPGVSQLHYMEELFASRPWYNLVPDQSHAFLTGGLGTYTDGGLVQDNDHATAAVTPDGSLGMVYVPTARTVTVNLNLLAGAVTAHWYDPSNNTFHSIAGSPFAPSSGSQQFTTPGNNAAGNGDWVLVLDAKGGSGVST